MNNKKTIGITITEGRVIRDLFQNKFLEILNNLGYYIVILSPAVNYDKFVDKYKSENIDIIWFPLLKITKNKRRLLRIRSYFLKIRNFFWINLWMIFERTFWKPDKEISAIIKEYDINLFVLTNPMFSRELEVNNTAQALGLKTIGVMRSWDNFWRGLDVRTDFLAVWSPINKSEAKKIMLYNDDSVKIIGPTPMDMYFSKNTIWHKKKFLKKINFKENVPIITVATLGSLTDGFDETYLLDFIFESIELGKIPVDTQVIIRLHPGSKYEYFHKYKKNNNTYISFIDKFIPTLGWSMKKSDVKMMANILYHSDIIISPGSTVTIEAAIFDTPILVPTFNPRQQGLVETFYQKYYWQRHFKRLVKNNFIPFQKNSLELLKNIKENLENPELYKSQRAQLVKDYIYYKDGKSTVRLANLIKSILD
jgi:hypothetical protein